MPCCGACRSSQARGIHYNAYGHLHRWSPFFSSLKQWKLFRLHFPESSRVAMVVLKPCLSCLSPSICGKRVQTVFAHFICPAFPFEVHGPAKTSQVIGIQQWSLQYSFECLCFGCWIACKAEAQFVLTGMRGSLDCRSGSHYRVKVRFDTPAGLYIVSASEIQCLQVKP